MNVKIFKKAGFTLVELMVSMVILLFISLALVQTALVSINANMRTVIRDEAVRVAESSMDAARNLAFASLTEGTTPQFVNSPARNVTVQYKERADEGDGFFVNTTVLDITSSSKRVDVEVFWTWRNVNYSHVITTIRTTR